MRDMICATVRVKSDKAPGGYVIINEDNFDGEVHVLADGQPAPERRGVEEGDETKSLADWRGAHWKTQVKLAKSLGFEGNPTAEQAKAFLAEKLP